jgi:hypothetical protein
MVEVDYTIGVYDGVEISAANLLVEELLLFSPIHWDLLTWNTCLWKSSFCSL